MILLFFVAVCITPLLANKDCTDRIIQGIIPENGVRDTTCDEFELSKGGDLSANIKPEGNIAIYNVWLYKCSGDIDETSFPTLRGYITKFQFSRCNLNHFVLPDMPNLKEIEITESQVPDLTADSFKNAPNLEQVIIRATPGFKMEHTPLKALHKVELLVIQGVNIPHLSKSSLEGLQALEDFSLANDNLEKLDEDTFEDTPKITRLNINEEKLKKIEPNTFKPLKQLESLDLTSTDQASFTLDHLSEQKDVTSLGLPTKFLVSIGLQKLKEKFPKLEEVPIDEKDEGTKEIENIRKIAEELKIHIKGAEIVYD